MKRFLAIFALLIFSFFSLSCEKETILSVDQTSITIPDTGGSKTVSLTTNKPWTASSNQSWCKVSPSAGEEASSSRITIACDANTSYDARNASVTFTCAEKTVSVNVSQATNNGLIVSQTEYNITNTAQQLEIKVQANVKFSVEVDNGCKDWVKYNTTKGLSNSTVVLDIAKNDAYDGREGKVTIKQTDSNLSATVVIKQGQQDGLFLTASEYNLSNEQHTLTVEVESNIEFEVKPEVDWIKYVETKGLKTNQIILDIAENDTYDVREGKVTVKQKNGNLTGTIIVKQLGKIAVESITLSKTKLEMKKGTKETLITIIRPENASNQNVTWSSSDSSIVSVHQGELTALKGGKATISASIESKSANCEVTVIVPIEAISLNKSTLTLEEGQSETLTVTFKPSDATNRTITWSSSASDIVNVDKQGRVTANKRGQATITAKVDDKKAQCDIIVNLKGTYIGNVTLSSNEEVRSFGEKGYRMITGDLTITNVGSVQLLNNTIEEIGGSLINSGLVNFDGLYSLKKIGGDLNVYLNNDGGLEGLNNLESIGGNLTLTPKGGGIVNGFQKLKEVKGNFNIESDLTYHHRIGKISGLNSLEAIGGNFIISGYGTTGVAFSITGLKSLRSVSGIFHLKVGMPIETGNSLPALVSVGSLTIEGTENGEKLFSSLTKVENDFYYSGNYTFSGFSKLKEVKGDFSFVIPYKNSAISTNLIDSFSSLEKVGGSMILSTDRYCSGFSFDRLVSIGESFILTTSYTIDTHGDTYPKITILSFKNLNQVGKDFIITSDGINNNYISLNKPLCLHFPKLIKVAGVFSLKIENHSISATFTDDSSLIKLTSVGSLRLKGLNTLNLLFTPNNKDFSIDNGGDLELSECVLNNSDIKPFERINSTLNNVTIWGCRNLTDFTPLIPIARKMTGQWSVTYCGYNPTKYQVLNGEAKKPD